VHSPLSAPSLVATRIEAPTSLCGGAGASARGRLLGQMRAYREIRIREVKGQRTLLPPRASLLRPIRAAGSGRTALVGDATEVGVISDSGAHKDYPQPLARVATWVDWWRSVFLNAQRIKPSCLPRNSVRLRSSGRYDCFARELRDYCDGALRATSSVCPFSSNSRAGSGACVAEKSTD
jgi:hypothetical protein